MNLRIPAFAAALLLAVLVGPTVPAAAQTATVRGFIQSQSDGQPLPGVNVILRASGQEPRGTATDSDGLYSFSRLPLGTYALSASFIGFETYVDTLDLAEGITTLNISLRESRAELDEIVVETEEDASGVAGLTAGLQTVRSADIEMVPMPDVSADLANYLTSLPGIVSQGDRGGQFFIRGGEPTQNLVLLDGMPIYQPFHFVGFFSAFPSEIINTADVHAGGFGGKYGGRLSSVIDISARTGDKRQFSGAASMAPFVAAVRVEGPVVPSQVSILGSIRQSMIEEGASHLVDAPLPFSFADRFGKLHANIGPGARLSATIIHTTDRGTIGENPLENTGIEDEVRMENLAYGARFIFLPSNLNIFAEILISRSQVESSIGLSQSPARSSRTVRTGMDANVTQHYGNLAINWGLAVHTIELDTDLDGLFQNLEEQREFVTEASAYISPQYSLRNGLRIEPGVRLQGFPSKGRSYLEPRLRVTWDLGRHRLSAAGGIYHQEIVGLNDRRDVGDVFTAWTSSPRGFVPEARHAILGWRMNAMRWLDVSLEGFYKQLSDLVVPEWTAFPRFTTRIHSARGTAVGLDARVEVSQGPIYFAASYGLSEVTYFAEIPALQLQFGEEETRYAPPHDRTHQISVMAAVDVLGFQLSTRWQFGSGLPYNQSIGFDRFVLLDSLVNVREDPGMERVLYRRPYTGRLPTYHRLDVSLERSIRIGGGASVTAQVGAINSYDRLNFFYLDLFTLRRVDQLPLIPVFGLKLEYN